MVRLLDVYVTTLRGGLVVVGLVVTLLFGDGLLLTLRGYFVEGVETARPVSLDDGVEAGQVSVNELLQEADGGLAAQAWDIAREGGWVEAELRRKIKISC